MNIQELQSTIGKGDRTRTTFPETEVKTKEEPNNQRTKATLLPAQIEPVGKFQNGLDLLIHIFQI